MKITINPVLQFYYSKVVYQSKPDFDRLSVFEKEGKRKSPKESNYAYFDFATIFSCICYEKKTKSARKIPEHAI
jgi:hypothetical protein